MDGWTVRFLKGKIRDMVVHNYIIKHSKPNLIHVAQKTNMSNTMEVLYSSAMISKK